MIIKTHDVSKLESILYILSKTIKLIKYNLIHTCIFKSLAFLKIVNFCNEFLFSVMFVYWVKQITGGKKHTLLSN